MALKKSALLGQETTITGATGTQSGQSDLVYPAVVGSQTVQIVASRTSGTFPCGVFFRAEVSGWDVTADRLRFKWHFGNTGETFSLADRVIAIWGAEADVAYLQDTSHCFTTAGPFTVSVEVTDGSQEQNDTPITATQVITVADPDDVFTGLQNIYVDNTGSHPDAPAGGQYVTTAKEAVDIYKDFSSAGCRIHLRAGQNHVGGFGIFNSGGLEKPLHIGSYGTGTRPEITPVVGDNGITFRPSGPVKLDIVITDVIFRGGANLSVATTPRGVYNSAISIENNGHTTVHNVLATGWEISIRWKVNDSVDSKVVMSAVEVDGYTDYGSINGYCWMSMIDCKWHQDPLCFQGFGYKESNTTDSVEHTTMRFSSSKNNQGGVVVRQTQFFSIGGHGGGNVVGTDPVVQQPPAQPCVRMGYHNSDFSYARFDRMVTEGASCTSFASKQGGIASDFILDKVLHLGSAITRKEAFTGQHSGITLRNIVVILPNIQDVFHSTGQVTRVMKWDVANPDTNDALRAVYNCTLLDQKANAYATTAPIITDVADPKYDFTNYADDNNLVFAPNRTVPLGDINDIEGGVLPITPLYVGMRTDTFPDLATEYATPAGSYIDCQLKAEAGASGSYDVDAGYTAIDDFYGALRPVVGKSKGAFEPSAT